MRISIVVAGVAAALLVTGCAGAETGGRPTVGTTEQTSGTPTAPVGPAQGLSTDPDTAIIEISLTDATVGGVQGVERIVVYGDGTVLRPTDDGGWTVAHLAPGVLDRLAEQAAADGLLGPLDFGDPGVTDMGWSDIALVTDSGVVEHHVYAPGWTDNLSSQELAARTAFSGLISAVSALDGPDLTGPEQPWTPERVLVQGFSGAALQTEQAVDWSGPTPLRDLIGASGCAVLTGADRAAAADLMAVAQASSGQDTLTVLATGEAFPAHLQLRLQFLLPQDNGCPVVEDRGPLVEPWPAEDRAPATAWQRWIADQAVVDGAERNAFGPEASSSSDLTWYEYDYSTGTVDGITVIDVVASQGYGSERDPETFAVRVDASTGKILDQL